MNPRGNLKLHEHGFKAGLEWRGNSKGRPRKIYSRDDFTEELFIESKEDIRTVKDRLFYHAKLDKPWAVRLVFEYFLTRPKNKDSEETANSNDINEKLKNIPTAKLIAIQKMLIEELDKEEE